MKDWYFYLTKDFKLIRKMYRVNERYPFDCPRCGEIRIERLNHVKSKIKKLSYYECGKCRKQTSAQRARTAFKEKHGNINPFQLYATILDKKRGFDYSEIDVNREDNPKEWNRQYKQIREKHDFEFKLKNILRNNITRMIEKSKIKNLSCTKIIKELNYSAADFRKNIESKFQKGMTWDNHGEWHIDHIKPISLFDITKLEDRLAVNALNNLQPLWAGDNLRKSNKY